MLKNVSFLDVPKCSATLEVSISRCQSVVCVAVPKLSPRLMAQLLPSFWPAAPRPSSHLATHLRSRRTGPPATWATGRYLIIKWSFQIDIK